MCWTWWKSGVRLLPSSSFQINKINYRHATSAYTSVTLVVIPRGSIRMPKAPCLSNRWTGFLCPANGARPCGTPSAHGPPLMSGCVWAEACLCTLSLLALLLLAANKQGEGRKFGLLVAAAKEPATRGSP